MWSRIRNAIRGVSQSLRDRAGGREKAGVVVLIAGALLIIGGSVQGRFRSGPLLANSVSPGEFPTVPSDHVHVRALLAGAMRYVAPEHGTIEPTSGYPVEGWNNEPDRGLGLRTFTQLTAIGQWVELLANAVAGHVDLPHLTPDQAQGQLARVIDNLRADQRNPEASSDGLLGNFLDLSMAHRQGPLAGEIRKCRFHDAFGTAKGEAIWDALIEKKWLKPNRDSTEAAIHRSHTYGANFFDGPMAPYADERTKTQIMNLLDRRVVMVVFGDNANLSLSVGKAIGALLRPDLKDQPRLKVLRGQMEQFLDDQQAGYTRLYDSEMGLFYFGYNATKERLVGWADGNGNWQPGYSDYLVNEFRGPTAFVILRYGLPIDPLKNLGFKMKPYRMPDGRDVYTLASWEGSAFQVLGLALSMMELDQPSWRVLLENIVDVEIDYSDYRRLPGFLSESYTGEGANYTGDVGIPEIAVSTMPRITHTPSLYTLGVAHMVAPEKVEKFLVEQWPLISTLITDHGPWEGYDATRQSPIRVQTAAHTLSLILGLLGNGSDHMRQYLESRALDKRLDEVYPVGKPVDLLAGNTEIFAWTAKGDKVESERADNAFHVYGESLRQLGIACVPKGAGGVSLSGGTLTVGYQSNLAMQQATIALKRVGHTPERARIIPTEIYTRFEDTDGPEKLLEIPLPATPGLTDIKEVVITWENAGGKRPVDFSITQLAFTPATL